MQQRSALSLSLCLSLLGWSAGCGSRAKTEAPSSLTAQSLSLKTLRFAQETRLLGETGGGGDGAFQATTFSSTAFRPSPFIVLPARTASFYQQKFATAEGFKYKTFTFVSSGCSTSAAFDRYFAAIEQLSGKAMPQADKDKVNQSFDTIFSGLGADGSKLRCLLFDLISCVAEYTIANAGEFSKVGAGSGTNTGTNTGASTGAEASALGTGASSCVSEVFGTDFVVPESAEELPES